MHFLGWEGITTRYIPEVLVKMRVGGESNKSLANLVLKTKEDLRAIKKNNVGHVRSIFFKNLSKIPQFFKRKWAEGSGKWLTVNGEKQESSNDANFLELRARAKKKSSGHRLVGF